MKLTTFTRTLLMLPLLILAACTAAPEAEPTLLPPPVPATSTPEPPTLPAPEIKVDGTEVVPTDAPTAAPTEAVSEAAEEPTPEPQPTEDLGMLEPYGPNNFPDNINQLTGLEVADPSMLQRRPLVIKISHFPRYVRPQGGLQDADMVFEHYSEGGTIRFSSIWYGQESDRVGPIRSARLIDLVLPELLDGALVTSGTSRGTLERLWYKPWQDLVIAEAMGYDDCPPMCRESEDTNSVFTDTNEIWNTLDSEDKNKTEPLETQLRFFDKPNFPGLAIDKIRVTYSLEAISEWTFNAVTQKYEHWVEVSQDEMTAHFDANTNSQVTADNVIILFAPHVVDKTVPEDYAADGVSAHFATEIQLWGGGPAIAFRNGQAYTIDWVNDGSGFLTFNVEGEPYYLAPGKTWFMTVGLQSEQEQTGTDWLIRHRSPKDQGYLLGVEIPTVTPEGYVAPEGEVTPAPEGEAAPATEGEAAPATEGEAAPAEQPATEEQPAAEESSEGG